MASVLGRFMSAMNGAWNGAVQGWNEKSLDPVEFSGWDVYAARAFRYSLNAAYYNNTVYSELNAFVQTMKVKRNLYKFIRGVRNPVARLVDLYVAKVYGGALDFEQGIRGAVPLQADDALRQAIIQLWKQSDFATQKTAYVRHGAMLGDVAIKLADEDGYVCMEFLHPGKVAQIEKDARGEITAAVLEYDVEEDTHGPYKTYRYREEITQEKFATYKDGRLCDFAGTGTPEWDNPYGFVPLAIAQHQTTGLDFGQSAFHTSLRKIDELNDAASLLNDQIRKAVNVVWLFSGVQKKDVDTTPQTKDSIPILYGGENARAQALLADLNIDSALRNIESMEAELERDMPELSLHQVRGTSGISGLALELMYSDAISRITGSMANYDAALCKAQAMGVAMSAYHRYNGFTAFRLDDYRAGNLAHSINARTIFEDTVSKSQRVQALSAVAEQPPTIAKLTLKELGYDDETIVEVLRELNETRLNEAAAAARGFGESLFGTVNDGQTTSPEQRPAAGGAGQTQDTQTVGGQQTDAATNAAGGV